MRHRSRRAHMDTSEGTTIRLSLHTLPRRVWESFVGAWPLWLTSGVGYTLSPLWSDRLQFVVGTLLGALLGLLWYTAVSRDLAERLFHSTLWLPVMVLIAFFPSTDYSVGVVGPAVQVGGIAGLILAQALGLRLVCRRTKS